MNNRTLQLGRCALIVLLSGLTILATAQVKTDKKTVSVEKNKSEITTNPSADFQGPIGILPTYEFVIEDDIMQSKDGENGNNGTKNDDGDTSLNPTDETNGTSSVKNSHFTTSTLRQLAQEIKVYPIPANSFTNIDLGQIKVKELEIINSLGQKVYSQVIEQQFLRLDISNYNTGIYFIQMRTPGNQLLTKSIMIN